MMVYDAVYVALTEVLNTVVYTADEKLIRRVRMPIRVKHVL